MQESDVQAFRAFAWSLVYQADTGVFYFSQCVCHTVFDGESYVMDACTFVFDELGNGAFGRSRFEKFDFSIAYFQKSGSYFLVFHCLNVVAFQAQYIFLVRKGFFNALNGNAQMLNV